MLSFKIINRKWPLIQEFINKNSKKNPSGRKRINDKKVIFLLLQFVKSGTTWRDFNTKISWKTLYSRFSRWCKIHFWENFISLFFP
jgi:transposase